MVLALSFLEDRNIIKIATSLIALAAAILFSTSAVAIGDCGDGHTMASSQQLVDAAGGQTPKMPKPNTGTGG
jgi:hypothetical protein